MEIYIMEKYWDGYIGGADDSLILLDYLADKGSEEIDLKEIFSELGIDKANYNFMGGEEAITITLNNGLELDFTYAIQIVCDLAALYLECKKNGSVNLTELGASADDEVVVTLTASPVEEKLILDVLKQFSNSPMEYDISEMCDEEEMEEMAELCRDLIDEVINSDAVSF